MEPLGPRQKDGRLLLTANTHPVKAKVEAKDMKEKPTNIKEKFHFCFLLGVEGFKVRSHETLELLAKCVHTTHTQATPLAHAHIRRIPLSFYLCSHHK